MTRWVLLCSFFGSAFQILDRIDKLFSNRPKETRMPTVAGEMICAVVCVHPIPSRHLYLETCPLVVFVAVAVVAAVVVVADIDTNREV